MQAEIWQHIEQLRAEGLDSQTAWRTAQAEYAELSVIDAPDADEDVGAASGKTCSTAHAITWVADNITNKSARAADAPSPTAWNLLKWVRNDPTALAEFWKGPWSKLIPSKSELEDQARYSDDGSNQIELAMRIQERLRQQRIEDERERKRRKEAYELNGAGDRVSGR